MLPSTLIQVVTRTTFFLDFLLCIIFFFVLGWPAFHQSTVHSSPLLYDIDKDGTREIALATYNGVINFFR